MAKVITIIDTMGKPKVTVEGAVGEECLKITKAVEDALGAVTKREMKDGGAAPITETVKAG